MDLSSLHSQLKTKQLQDFYIFTGTEWAVQKIYINQISTISGNPIFYADAFSDIYGKIKSPGFISKSWVYIVRDDKDIMQEEKVQAQIKNGLLGKNILILLVTNPDKRTKFYKAYKDAMVEFEPLKAPILKKYLQKEIPLSDANIERLMEICEYDYGRCLLEIDKIKRFDSKATNSAFEHLLKDGAIYTPPKDAIFDWVAAVLDRRVNLSYKLYNECMAVGEAAMVMLSVLYDNVKAVLQVQSCDSKDVSKSTGLTGWQIKNAKSHCGKYTVGELVYILRLIYECQRGIVTGTMAEEFVIDYIIGGTI